MKETRYVSIFIICSAILLVVLALTLNGTADSGDSVMHYLFARYAFNNPQNFFDVWAKPLYVLLASPFAQFGFTGIKLFNIINTVIAMVAGYKVATKIGLSNSWFVPVLLLLAPMNFALSLSGLTEPLFACLLISGLCLLLYDYKAAGLIVLSFLPFVRSEGMFLLMIVATYLIWQKKYVIVLWLFTGQVVYAVVGYFHFHSMLWFYQTNPYSFISKYGHGDVATYFNAMPLIIGPISCLLLLISVIMLPGQLLKGRKPAEASPPIVLIWALFIVYFFFHVIAWSFGLFGSFGMARIISAVSPLMAILCVYGFNQITSFAGSKLNASGRFTFCVIIAVIVINLAYMCIRFSGHIGEPGFNFTLSTEQLIENKMAGYIKTKYPDYKNRQVFYGANYISMALDIDPTKGTNPTQQINPANFPSKSLYVWDDWFSVVEEGISRESLEHNVDFVRDTVFSMPDKASNKMRTVALFVKK